MINRRADRPGAVRLVLMSLVTAAIVAVAWRPVRAHDQFRFVGTVVRMDVARNALTFKTVENRETLTLKVEITATTPIERDGRRVPRTELKPGVGVVVDALGDDYDSLEGLHIRIVPAPRTPATPPRK